MSDAFISYSRKDAEFVQANRVVWVDWQDIPRGEDWWRAAGCAGATLGFPYSPPCNAILNFEGGVVSSIVA
jgi:hypothetical protein